MKNKSSRKRKRKTKKNSLKYAKTTINQNAESPASIISPWIDFWCVGGVSIVVMVGLLFYIATGHELSTSQTGLIIGNALLLQAIINWPHFMASYRLLYTPVENIKKYTTASVWVPSVLLIITGIAVINGQESSGGVITVDQDIAYWVWLGAAFYLAWHYTGQAWGMIATFLYLSGTHIRRRDKLRIQGGLRILLIWHVVWGAQDLPASWLGPISEYIDPLLTLISVLGLISFFVSANIFWQIKKRTGKSPSIQVLAPWLAIYLWYLVLYFEPGAYIYVQLSHSLQYLIFPLRVELNRRGFFELKLKALNQLLWTIRYYIILVSAGLIFFFVPGWVTPSLEQNYTFAVLIASVISIHHYFVDGSIWKIGNPEVRKSLFSHIKSPVGG